jgi:hypothetical protein
MIRVAIADYLEKRKAELGKAKAAHKKRYIQQACEG